MDTLDASNNSNSKVIDSNQINQIPCRCGSVTHLRTNYSECILNKAKIHLLSPQQLSLINQAHNDRLLKLRIDKIQTNHDQLLQNNQLYRLNNKEHVRLKRLTFENILKENKEKENELYFNIAKSNNFDISKIFGKYVQINSSLPNYGRHIMPQRSIKCSFCDALVWIEEKSGGNKKKPLFSICCAQGKVKIPPMIQLPKILNSFLENKNFLANIRKYNAAFSFISFNATQDTNLAKGNIFTLRIQGQIHHRIGPLLPINNNNEVNAQIYFKDGNESDLRLQYSPGLNPCILIQIQAMLLNDCSNPFVTQFKKAVSIYKSKK